MRVIRHFFASTHDDRPPLLLLNCLHLLLACPINIDNFFLQSSEFLLEGLEVAIELIPSRRSQVELLVQSDYRALISELLPIVKCLLQSNAL